MTCTIRFKMVAIAVAFTLFFMPAVGGASAEGLSSNSDWNHVEYKADDAILHNPERGWYWAINPNYQSEDMHAPFTLEQLSELKNRPEAITLIRDAINLRAYRNGEISQEALDRIESDWDVVRQSGMKVVVRFLYNWSMENDDASKDIMLKHIEQLKPLLHRNADVIAWVQAGLYGGTGEANQSDNGYVFDDDKSGKWQRLSEDGKAIYLQLLNAVPDDRMMTVRYPRLKWDLLGQSTPNYEAFVPMASNEAYQPLNKSRIGFYSDGYMGDEHDFAMYQLEKEKEYTLNDSQYTLFEGEVSWPTDYNHTPGMVITHSKALHLTSLTLNQGDASVVYDAWKQNHDFDEVTKDMGYRFRLVDSAMPTALKPGAAFRLTLNMANDGFAGLVNARGVEVVLRNQSNQQEYSLSIDQGDGNRRWLPAGSTSRELQIEGGIPSDIPEGNYDVFLNLPDLSPSLKDRADYSIRLANLDTWEAESGYNDLLQSISIRKDAAGDSYAGNEMFTFKRIFEPDETAPFPDPLDWKGAPSTYSTDIVKMEAVKAGDPNGVEYYFANIGGGGHDSGWQSSPVYMDTGLQPDTIYTYRVKARDRSKAMNETGWSAEASVSTLTADFQPVSAPWYSLDIGKVASAGSALYSPTSGLYEVTASGEDIWGQSDQFHYAYQRMVGDVSIVARLVEEDPTNEWAKAGLMIRENGKSNAKNVMLAITPQYGRTLQFRTETGGDSNFIPVDETKKTPIWLKLTRVGDTFTAYTSNDGIEWKIVKNGNGVAGIDIPMDENVSVGLAFTSHRNTVAGKAKFTDVSWTGKNIPMGDPSDLQDEPDVPYAGTPFHDKPISLPGTILMSDYDQGGEGVSYYDYEAVNTGSYPDYRQDHEGPDLARINGKPVLVDVKKGEWTKYTVDVEASGLYDLFVHLYESGDFQLALDGADLTGSLGSESLVKEGEQMTVAKNSIYLSKGVHVIKFYANVDGGKFNSIELVLKKGTQQADIAQASSAIKIDGQLENAWNGVGEETIKRETKGHDLPESGDYRGKFQLMWDAANLYIAVHVTDKYLQKDPAVQSEDKVEIYLDPHQTEGLTRDNGLFYIINVSDNSIVPIFNTSGEGLQTATERIKDGYITEIAIPWTTIGIEPQQNLAFGLDIMVDDDIGEEHISQFAWNCWDDNAWQYLNRLGKVTLVSSNRKDEGAATQIYIVKKGDWLSKIARTYHTTWEELQRLNHLQNPNLIYPGQKLIIH